MNKEIIRKVLLVFGIILIVIYLVVMIFEVKNFSPYNTRMFLFADRALEFLLPGIVCIVVRMFLNKDR